MVEQFGMSPKIGPIAISQNGQQFLEGKMPWDHDRNASEELQRVADAEITRLVTESYDRALAILTEHEGSLRAVAEELKRKEVLDGDGLRTLVQQLESGVPTD
jgi:cell division protease FtsH